MNHSGGKPALILGSGEDVPVRPRFVDAENTVVICADGGAALARAWGLEPQIIIGDQDSLDSETKEYWLSQNVPIHRASPIKDETDLELAVDYALEQKVTSLSLIGGWGSRIDHSLGNVELLYRLALKGIPNRLLTRNHRLSAFCTEFRTFVRKDSLVSLIPLSSEVLDVTTQGLLYPLHNTTLIKGSTLGISNVAVATDISVVIGEGVLLVVTE